MRARTVGLAAPGRTRTRRLLALLLAGAVACASMPVHAESPLEALKRKAAEARRKLEADKAPLAAPTLAAPAAPAAPAAERPANRVDALRELMGRGTVEGAALLDELVALRTGLRLHRSAERLVAQDVAQEQEAEPTPAQAAQASKPDWKAALLTGQAGKLALNMANEAAGRVAFRALDNFLGRLTEDPEVLRGEMVKLPAPDGLTDGQVRRTATLATLVLTARVTKKLFDQAKRDIVGIEDEYKVLIDRREKAATLLYDAIGTRAQAQRDGNGAAVRDADRQLGVSLSREDLAFLETDLSRMSAGQFVNDIAAQNMAINYLRQRDPGAYADYSAQRDGTVRRTRAYLSTVAGAAAVGGLFAVFLREVVRARGENSRPQIQRLLRLTGEFLKEAAPLVQLAVENTGSVVASPSKTQQRFRVATAGASQDVMDAGAAFAIVKARGADKLLADSLFRTGVPGLLQRVHVCDGPETGRMVDTVVSAKEREHFAVAWFGTQVPVEGFAFVNALAPQEGASQREKDLADRLLRSNYRGERDDTVMPLGQLQERLAQGYGRWSSDQLMRLIFANREGAAAQATLQLGEVSVRPIPSMESIYVYEALIESCKSLLPRPATTAAAAPGPGR